MRASRLKARIAGMREIEDRTEALRKLELDRFLAAGPPVASRITVQNWADWHRFGFVSCPRLGTTCANAGCQIGVACRQMQAIGLDGCDTPLPSEGAANLWSPEPPGATMRCAHRAWKSTVSVPWRPFHWTADV